MSKDAQAMSKVLSRDGTAIAYWTSGAGPPLVLVHGAPADHTRWRPLLPHLEPHATVHALDRRGRGASEDSPPYELAREFEDVAAVVDAVAEKARATVDLYGHSFGGLCAFGAAALTANVRKLMLYEGWPSRNPAALAVPPGVGARLDALLAQGDGDAIVTTVFRELVGMPDAEIDALREQPSWRLRVEAAHTIPRELGAMADARFDPEQAASIAVPTLLLTGSESHDPAAHEIEDVAAALPDARIVVLEGQEHVADILVPDVFAEQVVAFLRD